MTVSPEKTREALEASIKAWKAKLEIENPRNVPMGVGGCPLCALFHGGYRGVKVGCFGCPVREHTGENYCEGTPYNAAEKALELWQDGEVLRKTFIKAAEREIAFLESLRETDHAEV